jgi:hypothetical protein
MSKKFIILLLILIFVSGIYIKTEIREQNKIIPQAPISTPTPTLQPESSLSFAPDTIYSIVGQSHEVNIQLNSQGKYPTSAQLELAYDPTILTEITLTPGALFPNPKILLNNIDEATGRISFALSLSPNEKPRQMSAVAAKMKFKIRENTLQNQTAIYFLPKTSIISQDGNIPLKITYGLKIFIK